MTIESAALYTLLTTEFAKARERLRLAGAEENEIALYVTSSPYDKTVELRLTVGHYGNYKAEVQGKSLGDIVTEAVSRMSFSQRQKYLELTHEAEGTAVPPPAPSMVEDAIFDEPEAGREEVLEEQGNVPTEVPTSIPDDEIPF